VSATRDRAGADRSLVEQLHEGLCNGAMQY